MRFDRLDLNLLVALDKLLEFESVTLAARSMGLTQSSMSGALERLRAYFGDELLVKNGRRMMATPRARQMRPRVRDVLIQVRSTITSPVQFDPRVDARSFAILCSDHVVTTFLRPLIEQTARDAPNIRFTFMPIDRHSLARFEQGEMDLVITLMPYAGDGHPQQVLFQDEAVGVCWTGNTRIGDEADHEQFVTMGHVAAAFGEDRFPSFFDRLLEQRGIRRTIEVTVHSFGLVPFAVVGTERLAIMHRRHAELLSEILPLRIFRLPVALPPVYEVAQWHRLRGVDAGLQWLLARLEAHGKSLQGAEAAGDA